MTPLAVAILIPVYGAEEQLRRCLQSLAEFAPPGCTVTILDDATPGTGVQQVAHDFESLLPLTYIRQPANLGFVENCNSGILSVLHTGSDILLLNSDTRITSGAIEEMYAVLHLHELNGVVTPRSNNATIYSIPVFESLPPARSHDLWLTVGALLHRYTPMPTAVGFCMLIRGILFRHFGVFDPIYTPGYNEENDFVCRINRRGFSAVAANHAFVFHDGRASFGPLRDTLDSNNHETLISRYPEYPVSVANYLRYEMDPVDRFAHSWLPRKKSILFDLFHLTPSHSGTSEFGLALLLHLAPLLHPTYKIAIGLTGPAREFFRAELTGCPIIDEAEASRGLFHLAFKPCQLFEWRELRLLAHAAPRIAFTLQDSIAIRCRYLQKPAAQSLHANLPGLVEKIIAISHFTNADFASLHRLETEFPIIYQGIHPSPPTFTENSGYILIAGNAFEHKGLQQTVEALTPLGRLVVLGGPPGIAPNVEYLVSGHLTHAEIHELFSNAAVVVYPSYYEGFGLPVLTSLGLGRPTVALDTAVNRELQSLTANTTNLHLAQTHSEMLPLIGRLLAQSPHPPPAPASVRTWKEVAAEYAILLEEAVNAPVDIPRLRHRWNWLAAMDSQNLP